MGYEGGYVITKHPLILASGAEHTAALEHPVSQIDLDALNHVSATPWRINGWLFDIANKAWVDDIALPGLRCAEHVAVPPRLPDAVWEGMSEAERREHVRHKREAHDANASLDGREHALLDQLSVARELRDVPSIYYPHARCFRGRIYPIPTAGPHPQGSDLGKALLMFSSGLPLGPDGLFWLCVRAANCAGQDKMPLQDRVQWALDHRADIAAADADPFGCLWWADAEHDEPWGLLATCHELAMAFREDNPETFVSHLPIPMDGSCNGLQHLSAMALDPIGARATNLCAGQSRQDVYMEVAKHVIVEVEKDAAEGIPEALAWYGKVTRKTVKRAVMTTPYGVTDRGIRRQLIDDGVLPSGTDDKGGMSDYMGDKISAALGVTIRSGREIMTWLQVVASRLADVGRPFDWTTPTGSRCRQAYYRQAEKRVSTLVGTLQLREEIEGSSLPARKQALGAAPNFIHSFDAAHLALTVNACFEEGIRSFAMIHDSYGTHAANTTTLNRVLREKFVEIYREDWLARLYDEVSAYAPEADIPSPYAEHPRGSFNIEEVLDAEFFFS